MCFHGLGHGILAAVGYDMHKAVEICKKTSVRQPSEEINQCASGTVMEIIGGGFHDREFWSVQRLKYLSTERPLEPCSLDYIPDAAKPMCYAYLTPHLFDAAGSDAGNPNPAHFKDAFLFCGSLPLSETGNRDACYGGFGKEFVVLANSRDTRKGALENFADGGLMKVHEWCALAPHEEALFSCTTHAVDSFYWGGENDRRIALRFCDLASETVRPVCVQHLIGIVSYFIQDEAYRRGFCAEVPEAYRTKCEAQLF